MSAAKALTKPMREAKAKSGYLLEQRLVPVIERAGFTGDLRELDISAISGERIGKRGHDFLFPILLVACKHLTCPLVFFTQQEVRLRWFLGKVQISGLPLEILDRDRKAEPLAESLEFEDFHHYYRTGRVASQFCAVYENKKVNPPIFEAGHTIGGRMELFKDCDGSAKAVLANKREHGHSFYSQRKPEPVNLQIYYPIFLTAGPIIECHVGKQRPSYRQVHRIGFLYRTEIGNKQRDIRVDAVDEDGFKRLLKTIENETAEIVYRLARKQVTIKRSLDWVTKRLRRWKPERQKSYVAGELLD
jgi:hypothetical protein